jgi:cyclopropane fatty-acyl-phospholipid synthase-like methyltransferase
MSNLNDMTEVPYWADRMPQNEPNLDGVPEHLGGHYGYTNMDRPSLKYLVEHFNIKSMLDVGCGTGGMVEYAHSLGLDALGVDGDTNVACDHIVNHDFTQGAYIPDKEYDLIWCVEFVEHVEAKFIPNFLETFRHGKILMMTFAPPGQGGKHHVNLQTASYWTNKLYKDWKVDRESTDHIRNTTTIFPYMERATVRIRK